MFVDVSLARRELLSGPLTLIEMKTNTLSDIDSFGSNALLLATSITHHRIREEKKVSKSNSAPAGGNVGGMWNG